MNFLIQAVIYLSAAIVCVPIAKRLGMGSVLGYLLAGMLIGPFVLGFVGKVGEDMNFAWVNKDNILQVYQDFYDSYKENKENFSREDYDEVKLLYEALDSRKNTVEKEGLTTEDNNKIASIKFKFAPMFKVNRMGAKARENTEAKE